MDDHLFRRGAYPRGISLIFRQRTEVDLWEVHGSHSDTVVDIFDKSLGDFIDHLAHQINIGPVLNSPSIPIAL